MKHLAWDKGVILDAVGKTIGVCPLQKTTKTLCGKRVKMSRIDNNHPTCPDCLDKWNEECEIIYGA